MKNILLLLLLLSMKVSSQETTAGDSPFVIYEYKENPKVKMVLPGNAEIKPDGKFIINGRTYHIETDIAENYFDCSNPANDTITSKQRKDIITLISLSGKKSERQNEDISDRSNLDYQIRKTDNSNLIIVWYAYKTSNKLMIEKLHGSRIINDFVFMIAMEENIDPTGEELKAARKLLFEILDSAVITVPKAKNNKRV